MFHYVHGSLIYNSPKLERTQMPLNREMDTENVVHLHNGVGFLFLHILDSICCHLNFDLSHSDWCEMESKGCFDLHLPDD